MRAIVCERYGDPDQLQLWRLPETELEARQIRVVVKAAGVNFVDSAFIAGGHQRNFHAPFIPGGDIAGDIVEVGRCVSGFKPGDRVLGAACLAAGADKTINYNTADLKSEAKAITRGRGVDVGFDPVGGETSERALRACGPAARFLVVGFATGTIPQIPLNLPLVKRCQIVGVDWGASAKSNPGLYLRVCEEILSLYTQGKLPDPPLHQYPLAMAGQALLDLQQRRITGKAVIETTKSSMLPKVWFQDTKTPRRQYKGRQ